MSVVAVELTRLIGLPWVAGARGPEAYDCWGLVRLVHQRLIKSKAEKQHLQEAAETPKDVKP